MKTTDTLTPEELREIEERISQDDVAISHGMRTEVDPADYFEIAEQLLAHIRADQWQPIETAPKDVVHLRGLLVRSVKTGEPADVWQTYMGFETDDGEFVDDQYLESFGWDADDYTHWKPLPSPPQEQS